MNSRMMVAALTVAASWLASPARADDRKPPGWRWTELSVSAEWDFKHDTSPASPDRYENYGDGVAHLNHTLPRAFIGGGLVWQPDGSQDGRWFNPGPFVTQIQILLPDWETSNPLKEMRVQVTYTGSMPGFDPVYGWIGDDRAIAGRTKHYDEDGYFYEDWTFQPNPYSEQLFLNVPVQTAIDQIVIDTRCLPAPGTITGAIVAVGIFCVRRRR